MDKPSGECISGAPCELGINMSDFNLDGSSLALQPVRSVPKELLFCFGESVEKIKHLPAKKVFFVVFLAIDTRPRRHLQAWNISGENICWPVLLHLEDFPFDTAWKAAPAVLRRQVVLMEPMIALQLHVRCAITPVCIPQVGEAPVPKPLLPYLGVRAWVPEHLEVTHKDALHRVPTNHLVVVSSMPESLSITSAL